MNDPLSERQYERDRRALRDYLGWWDIWNEEKRRQNRLWRRVLRWLSRIRRGAWK